jgi:hypothetical protein
MSLQDIVNVQISKITSGVSRVGFGTPLVLTYHTKDASRVLEFTDAASMLTAAGGPFDASDMAFILAQAAFAQDPKPDKILVGRRVHPTIRTVDLEPRSGVIAGETHPLPETDYSVTISRDGVEETFTHTTDTTPTLTEILGALETAINAGGVDVLATNVGPNTSLKIEAADGPGGTPTAGTPFLVSFNRQLWVSEDQTPAAVGGDLPSEIAAISAVNDDWYGIVGDWWGKTEIEDVSDFVEGLFKLHAAMSQDDGMYDQAVSNDVGSLLQSKALARTFLFHHPDAVTIGAAMLGKNLPKDPGSITWKFKTLATIPFVEYTPGEKSALANKNIERYIRIAGNNLTCDGKTSSGEFIDITRFVDFIRVRLQENIFFRLKNADKVPFTDPGIAIIENEVRGVMQLGISVGGFAADPAPEVTVPLAADVSINDKANRLLPDVKFNATLAGAIHELEVRGVVTV